MSLNLRLRNVTSSDFQQSSFHCRIKDVSRLNNSLVCSLVWKRLIRDDVSSLSLLLCDCTAAQFNDFLHIAHLLSIVNSFLAQEETSAIGE